MDALDLAQGTAYAYVNRLVGTGVIEATSEEQPRRYVAREIDLSVTSAGERLTTTSIRTLPATGLPGWRRRSPILSTANGARSPTA